MPGSHFAPLALNPFPLRTTGACHPRVLVVRATLPPSMLLVPFVRYRRLALASGCVKPKPACAMQVLGGGSRCRGLACNMMMIMHREPRADLARARSQRVARRGAATHPAVSGGGGGAHDMLRV